MSKFPKSNNADECVGGKLSCFMPGHNPIFVQIIHLGCLLPHHNQQFVLTGRRFAEAASLWDKPWSVSVNRSDNPKDVGQNQSLSLKPPCTRLHRASSLFIVETWHYQLHNVGFCDLAKTNMVWRGLKTTRQCLKAPLDSRGGARKMPELQSPNLDPEFSIGLRISFSLKSSECLLGRWAVSQWLRIKHTERLTRGRKEVCGIFQPILLKWNLDAL